MGLGGMGIFGWLLMALPVDVPFWIVVVLSASPVAVYGISSFGIWPDSMEKSGQILAFRLYLGLALVAFVVGSLNGFTIRHVFPGGLILLGIWQCVLVQLPVRKNTYIQGQYQRLPKRADGSLIIQASKVKLAWLVVLVALMFGISVAAIPSVAGWVGSLLFGALMVLAIYVYRPSANYLRVGQDEIEIVIAGQRSKLMWRDIAGFHVGDSDGDKMVAVLFTDAYLRSRAEAQEQPGDGWIRDIFVLRPEVLCSVLSEWHMKPAETRLVK